MSTTEKNAAAPKATASKKPVFPREVAIVNDTAVDYVVCGKFAAKASKTAVTVNDADEIVRMKSDCEQIVSLNDAYKGSDEKEPAVRVTEAE